MLPEPEKATPLESLGLAQSHDSESHPAGGGIMIVDNDGERSDLRLSNELIAKMAEGVCLIRARDDAILYANPSFEKMFGYDVGEIIGKNVATLNAATSETPDEVAREISTELKRNGLWRGEVLNSRKDEIGRAHV